MDKNIKPIEYKREEWGDGPWQNEPDRVEFKHEDFDCLILRTQSGHLCGYVALTSEHPDFEKDYDSVNVECHGGLTYANHCSGHICHVPKEGEEDNVWWLGFDHAHSGDYSPQLNEYRKKYGNLFEMKDYESYKDIEYVTKGVKHLAEQLRSIQDLGYNKFLVVEQSE